MMSTETANQNHRHLSTTDKLKQRQNEKYERNYRHWQQAKAESKQDHYKHLKERVALQHDLINAQDELSKQKREKQEHCIFQKREAQKASRHAREEALLNICRQSLEEDKKSSSVGRQSRASCRSRQAKSEPALSPCPGPSSASSLHTLVTEQLRTVGSCNPEPVAPYKRHTLSPFVVEDEEDEKGDQGATARKDSVPWHHAQLYHLYGNQADYFLYPKIEPKPQKQLHPKLRNPGGGGAEVLWAGLRNESVSRLRRYDRNVPKELKSAFSAFVRQSLSKNKPLVERNYCPTDDVPDLPRLLDKTELHKAYSLRHKLQLMHRSSLTNADRTRVLTYNNPFPDLNNLDGGDSIDRYLPSWLENYSEISEPDYKKWLQGRQLDVESLEDSVDWPSSHSAIEKANPHKQPKYLQYPKLQFLKYEKDSDILEAARKSKNDAQTASQTEEFQTTEQPTCIAPSEKAFKDNATFTSHLTDPQYRTSWQPLSMTALVEYTQKLETKGVGPFQNGQTKMWQTSLST